MILYSILLFWRESLPKTKQKHFFSIHEFRFFVDFVVCCFRCKINWWFYFFFINSFVELHHTHTHTHKRAKMFYESQTKIEREKQQTNKRKNSYNEETRIFFLSLFIIILPWFHEYIEERERESSIHSTQPIHNEIKTDHH